MLKPAFPALEIFAQLPPGGLLLTPNNRLRNRCQQVYAVQQPPGSCWLPPPVESLQSWLDKLWFELQQCHWRPALKRVLNREQRQLLWHRALDQSLKRQLLNRQQLCRDADRAVSQLIQWQLVTDIQTFDKAITPLMEQFALSLQEEELPLCTMIRAFAETLHTYAAITPDQRDQLILRALREGVLKPLPQITMAGFTQISPLAGEIIRAATHKVYKTAAVRQSSQLRAAACADREEELCQAARWAAQMLAQHPGDSIGIVVNNLGQCRARVETVFSQVLEPQCLDPQQPHYTLPFNFSAGVPLAQTPVGSAALQLLDLLRDEWDCDALRNTLFCPFWSGSGETWLCSALYRRLQKLQLRRIDGATLRYWAEHIAETLHLQSPRLPGQLALVAERSRRWQHAPAEIWAKRLSSTLADLGWPGTRTPNSQEYQQLILWETTLENLAALNAYAGDLTLAQALQLLHQIAKRTPFQAETRDGPLQILGVLEAGGLAFDHLRLVGFGQQQWPPTPAPNPLLPIQWQKHWKMPRSSVERELTLAQGITTDLLNASGDIVVSYACEEDGAQQGLSSLFGHPEPAEYFAGDALQCHFKTLAKAVPLEKIDDAWLPPLAPKDCQQVRGGASVLKAQALCPLNAQLRYRLGAGRDSTPDIGLSPAERGNIVHRLLAEFWQRCGTLAQLQAMDETQRHGQIAHAIERALAGVRRKYHHLPGGFWALEAQRLQRLMHQWLATELQRPAFSVKAIEWEQAVQIDGLHFNLRLDRLDQLPSGERLVIDYKTGTPSIRDWLTPRIREPQLPLYALIQPRARAITFGQVRSGDCQWHGCGALEQPIAGIKAVADIEKNTAFGNWNSLVAHWRENLKTLAGEYRSGAAALTFDRPADNATEFWPLNRWPERAQRYE
ncbi:PD-(D/E)XK nuclease family protein [Microbulbifer spongiae]|uniref:PD-(D/E)XK nuclease family protein n=1 Tax=Microbulbifer spongiae TaxID=2944933 RepID=A0ABY9EHZ6_9GAMM|nr:PD-(D/E)XK nuclease family protein [Microbulbifer sp. MI-G]WKD51434.1 PD-(D/E)XK nuclease family protein [Microbulbifer sp. MI-G]